MEFPALNFVELTGSPVASIASMRRDRDEVLAITEDGDTYRVFGVHGSFAVDQDRRCRMWFEHIEPDVLMVILEARAR